MSKSTISTFELFAMFPDQDTARVYLGTATYGRKAPNVQCAALVSGSRRARMASIVAINARKISRYVPEQFLSARTFRCTSGFTQCICFSLPARASPACSYRRKLASRQASAWFMLHRIREACGPDLKKLRGIIEIDECFVGGKRSQQA